MPTNNKCFRSSLEVYRQAWRGCMHLGTIIIYSHKLMPMGNFISNAVIIVYISYVASDLLCYMYTWYSALIFKQTCICGFNRQCTSIHQDSPDVRLLYGLLYLIA